MWGFSFMGEYAKYDKLEILWHDAVRTSDWGDKPCTSEKEMRCKTLGYFFEENDHSLTVTSTYGHDRGDYLHTLQIPKGSIIKIKELENG